MTMRDIGRTLDDGADDARDLERAANVRAVRGAESAEVPLSYRRPRSSTAFAARANGYQCVHVITAPRGTTACVSVRAATRSSREDDVAREP